MTDSRLQELKRAWEASGSVEDEAAYLRERVRVGDLTQERLELAAYCGHPAAAAILDPKVNRGPELLGKWIASLQRFGRATVLQSGLAAVELAASSARGRDPRLKDCIDLARRVVRQYPEVEQRIALEVHDADLDRGVFHNYDDAADSFALESLQHLFAAALAKADSRTPPHATERAIDSRVLRACKRAAEAALAAVYGVPITKRKSVVIGQAHPKMREVIEEHLRRWAIA